ncbi:MAG: hypothetical protein M1402_04500 [Candidatus Thermoplasmatota archaeon]|nr:hypothetical protein [Candidatus Thermoplasmatota archaeon]MCL5666091.1 hypothetical protein [Candidatus Thermoplasmatota archaeon]
MKVDNGRTEKVERLSNEIKGMRREIDDLKEVLRGLIQVIMSREGSLDDEEYN